MNTERTIGDVLACPSTVPGVWWTTHLMHGDERGSLTEAAINSTAFELGGQYIKQVNVSMSRSHVLRGMHLHKQQMDWWYIAGGVAQVMVQSTLKPEMIDTQVLFPGKGVIIPPGTGHGFLVLDDLALIYAVSNEFKVLNDEWGYQATDAGEWRLPPEDWIISKRDREAMCLKDMASLFHARM